MGKIFLLFIIILVVAACGQQPKPGTPSASTPVSPFERGWQVVQVPSLDYDAARAASMGCNKHPERIGSLAAEGSDRETHFFSDEVVGVWIMDVYKDVHIKATPSGAVLVNISDFPEGEIRDAYFRAALEGRYFYSIQVRLQPEPDLEKLTTPAEVLCLRW